MNDLISRQAAIAEAYDVVIDGSVFKVVQVETLYGLPTIDPVKHGKWIKIGDDEAVQCSECLEDFDYIDGLCYLCHGQELPNYCPNCGARMDIQDAESVC